MNKYLIKIKYITFYIVYGIILNRVLKNTLSFEWKKNQINRTDLINRVLKKISENKKLEFVNYLEIGCFNDENFNKIHTDKINKIGVDPISGGNIRLSSDNFFQNNKTKFHCIFIDGLHIYEQVQQDFLNSLKFIHDDGYIIMHDCIPRNFIEEHVPRFPGNQAWTGDVWKVCMEIDRSPDLKLNIFLCDNGVGIIKVRKNKKNYIKLNQTIKNKRFKFFILNCFDNFNKINELDKYL